MDSKKPDQFVSSLPATLASGRFSGREAFDQLVRNAFAQAAREGWPEIILCDATFKDWPLCERSVVDSLHAWAASGRRLIMLATGYDEVIRSHARFVTWRKTWGHIIDCRICRVAAPLDFPSAIWSRSWSMLRVDTQRSIGTCGYDRERRVYVREILDEKIRKSSSGFPISTLGL